MAKNLIIVESPAKTKTLRSFLGAGYRVEASMGHVRDLPRKTLGVDVDRGFAPRYVTIPERRDALRKLKDAASGAGHVYLASDPDREGEAIAFHLAEALGLADARRIEFNEITRSAVLAALEHPRAVDTLRVDAQEARRVLDRLVGYSLSPLLWKKVRTGLSAGRVQSVVLRLICDREREILAFVPEEYWSLTANLTPRPPAERFPFKAKLTQRDQRKITLKTQADADAVLAELAGAAYRVAALKQREQRRNPNAPFTTSTLQQEASRKLGFSNRRTMQVAQQLYEGIDLGPDGTVGLITYMRSDSVRVASEAQAGARSFIKDRFGEAYVPRTPPVYKTKGPAQDAHEAVRPTAVQRTPESVASFLKPEQLKLYRLIWERFVASQMAPAVLDVTTVDISAGRFTFRATGSVVKFDGFMRVYTESRDTQVKSPYDDEETGALPALTVGQDLDLIELLPKQHFTEPPPRYTEATLVKALDEKGIGRPSTWATFIATILERGYAVLEERKFKPTNLGFTVTDLLILHFPDVMDVDFTSTLETRLDDIEEGQAEKLAILAGFWGPFKEALDRAHEQMERVKPVAVETDHVCPKCGRKMVLRQSEHGPFLGCSGFPKCKTVLNEDGTPVQKPARAPVQVTDKVCPKCGKPLAERTGKYGPFLGCTGYPKCKTIVRTEGSGGPAPAQAESTGVKCPKDGGDVVAKRSRRGAAFYGCANYPACDFVTWHKPIGRECPSCGWPLGEQSFRGRKTGMIKCANADCDFQERAEPAPDTPPEGDE